MSYLFNKFVEEYEDFIYESDLLENFLYRYDVTSADKVHELLMEIQETVLEVIKDNETQ